MASLCSWLSAGVAFVALALVSPGQSAQLPGKDAGRQPAVTPQQLSGEAIWQKVEALLAQMMPEEKAGQLPPHPIPHSN